MIARQLRIEILFRALMIAALLFGAITPSVQAQGPAPTQTETPTETPTAEPTVTPTTTPTPVIEVATPSPTITASETPVPATPDDSVPKAETPTLSLSIDPQSPQPGEPLTLHWTIEGLRLEEHKLVLRFTLPEGFSLQANYEGTFDEATRTHPGCGSLQRTNLFNSR